MLLPLPSGDVPLIASTNCRVPRATIEPDFNQLQSTPPVTLIILLPLVAVALTL
ncbi:hypothetical protein [Arsukibacterium sp.]|uniref:hypothetical protein n=1 Tax=Arsukibacterium sp. TaxID=1977258 RepID=UPI00299EDCFB|nr:hypothetical protein [Arsukibacterium sp.]MDX1538819.1 hypothetical protein [Arsukibacterium sp.]